MSIIIVIILDPWRENIETNELKMRFLLYSCDLRNRSKIDSIFARNKMQNNKRKRLNSNVQRPYQN